MTRDYSKFLTPGATHPARTLPQPTHVTFGWQPFFAQQTSVEALADTPPVRVTQVHRNGFHVVGDQIDMKIASVVGATVGDWLLLDREFPAQSTLLDRKSLLKRRAPGHDRQIQMIAANIDTVFVVTSCNRDFNVARLERFVAMAFEAEITPVILLTKRDQVDSPEDYVQQAQAISDRVSVIALDARGTDPKDKLALWCKPGQTVAFLGSSGVGKSTLTNALAGDDSIATQAIREDDARGRHTTTRRQLHAVPGGCLVLDTPGMRELQLTDAAAGIGEVFEDLNTLANDCKFSDCNHDAEPDCAVKAALERGDIDLARLNRWRKLLAEEAHNTATLAERRSRDKAFGKKVRTVVKGKKSGNPLRR